MRSQRISNSLPILGIIFLFYACTTISNSDDPNSEFQIVVDEQGTSLTIFKKGSESVVLTQNAQKGMRPYLHPIMAPDGNGALTEFSPGHHKHQTGLYWGFTRVNGTGAPEDTLKRWFYDRNKPDHIKQMIGRDYFHFNGESHWRRVALNIVEAKGEEVQWQTVYEMLDENGQAILEETMNWSLKEQEEHYLIGLEWEGKALDKITINQFDYGGLFLRMPWREGIEGEVVNVARQRNQQAEGKKAMWVDAGMAIEGREDWGHIAIFDHPQNPNFPTPWRVDNQLGIGPCLAIEGDWTIEKGETKRLKHQIVAYTGELNDVAMTDLWMDYIGDSSMYVTASLWNIAREEGLTAKFLSPQEAVDEMTIKEGYQVNVFASEPMITQPMAFCWDDRGRMWIAENRDYENRQEGFANDGNSRILILEDTNHDGVADTKKVFAEGIPFPAALAVGFDGVFVGAPPNLLFIPDRDHDDQADMDDIEVRLTGWGIRDRHETINSFHWGPDGWLYGLEGFATPSKIRKPQGKGRLYNHKDTFPDVLAGEGVDINGGVWRYHPTKDRFEVVAHGFSNPWGIDYDAKGQLFITACVIPHMFHVIPGGIYHRQGGQHFNPYVYQDIRTIVDHSHRSAHGGARIYQSDAFPADQWGHLFMANIHEHAVLSDYLVPNGSGYIAKHADDFLMANNAQWIGFSVEIGPGGNLYVLDWHDADICGNSVKQKETGRVFRISPKDSQAEDWNGRYGDLRTFSDLALAELQTSKSDWHARRARVILQNRSTKGELEEAATEHLLNLLDEHENQDYRLRALWTLHITSRIKESKTMDLLRDANPHIRAWSVQLLCEDQKAPESALAQFIKMAQSDPSPVVRLYLAAALQRIPEQVKWSMVEGLLGHEADAEDHNIPKMVWFAFEELVGKDPKRALAVVQKSKIPLVTRFVARRAVDGDQVPLVVQAIDEASQPLSMLEGLRAGLEGRSDINVPDKWPPLANRLSKNPKTKDLALSISQQFGDSEAANRYLAVLMDSSKPVEDRNKAIKALAQRQWPELEPNLPGLWEQEGVRVEAIRALAAYDNYGLGLELMKRYQTYSANEKLEVLQAMASRSSYGGILTKALKNGDLSKKEIPAYVARQLRRVVGNGFVEIWGPIDDLGIDKDQEMKKYKAILTESAMASANVSNGKSIFQASCGACHQLFGQGGILGPDLTGSNRQNLDYILYNMLDPSGDIQDDYKMVVITTRDGRTYAGNIAQENDRQVTMRVVGTELVVINKSAIQSRETSPSSMMPEGLLQTLEDQEVIDLVAYLRVQEDISGANSTE